jgi:hypothetical protein
VSAREELVDLGFEIPDSIEPIVAYRSWLIMGHVEELRSHCLDPWTPGVPLKARCRYRDHALPLGDNHHSPVESCTCGIYAAKEEDIKRVVPIGHVYGEVYLWGKVVEGKKGYRAEFAYPKQFFVKTKDAKKMVSQMGFGVPITVRKGGGRPGFPFPVTRTETFRALQR